MWLMRKKKKDIFSKVEIKKKTKTIIIRAKRKKRKRVGSLRLFEKEQVVKDA